MMSAPQGAWNSGLPGLLGLCWVGFGLGLPSLLDVTQARALQILPHQSFGSVIHDMHETWSVSSMSPKIPDRSLSLRLLPPSWPSSCPRAATLEDYIPIM